MLRTDISPSSSSRGVSASSGGVARARKPLRFNLDHALVRIAKPGVFLSEASRYRISVGDERAAKVWARQAYTLQCSASSW